MQKISTMRTNAKNIFQGQLTIGLDLGDRSSAYCVLNEAGEIVLEHKLATTPEAMKQAFGSMPRCRIAMETGTHSPWVSRLLTALDHEVIVGHAQKVRLITKSRRKDDRLDARTLARLARIDLELLSPVKHRSAQAQLHLTEIRARAVLVSARTTLVNAARGLVEPQMRISKEGDEYLRTLLVQGAHNILGPFGEDSDLRRWGRKLSARGGKNAKKRAVVAVARKLAVLLHRLWVSGEVYEPLHNSQKAMNAAA
jgi:transposase